MDKDKQRGQGEKKEIRAKGRGTFIVFCHKSKYLAFIIRFGSNSSFLFLKGFYLFSKSEGEEGRGREGRRRAGERQRQR